MERDYSLSYSRLEEKESIDKQKRVADMQSKELAAFWTPIRARGSFTERTAKCRPALCNEIETNTFFFSFILCLIYKSK